MNCKNLSRLLISLVCFAFLLPSLKGAECKRLLLPSRYSEDFSNIHILQSADEADWIWKEGENSRDVFLLFRNEFESNGEPLTFHLTADERFVLKLDGKIVARGPERSTVRCWVYQSYQVDLSPGKHVIDVVVWRIGPSAPLAQLSWHVTGGFLFKAESSYDQKLTSGVGNWKVAKLSSPEWLGPGDGTFGVGSQARILGTSPIFQEPEGSKFVAAKIVRPRLKVLSCGLRTPGWGLFPSTLAAQLSIRSQPGRFVAAKNGIDPKAVFRSEDASHEACKAWNRLLHGEKLTIEANTETTLLWDLGDYYCAYPELYVTGGAGTRISWGWSEALYRRDPKTREKIKGNRNEFDGKTFFGFVDEFLPNGNSSVFSLPWWRPGRWCQLTVKTGDKPITIDQLSIEETHYPLKEDGSFVCEDSSLAAIQKICFRGMEMCSHEMGFDCPYYEQQMYPGDTRIQLLVHNVLSNDDTFIRRVIDLFDFSRNNNGSVAMNFPTRGTQESWTYTMIWPLMLGDYAMWHTNDEWLRARLPGLAAVMAGLRRFENSDGLLENLPPWNFMDWVPEWKKGVSPDGNKLGCLNNLFYIYALKSAAIVERKVGDPEMARIYDLRSSKTADSLLKVFWSEKRGMLADNVAKTCFSEHAQSLALILDLLPPDKRASTEKNLLEEKDLARCTVYFSHYLFEAYLKIGRADLFLKRLDLWRDYVDLGLCTPLEMPGNARSDCHAWGSHPLYHLHTGIAGVRPDAPSFRKVVVSPQPGSLKTFQSRTPHPKGFITQDLCFGNDGSVSGTVTLPTDLSGRFDWFGQSIDLKPGKNSISLKRP